MSEWKFQLLLTSLAPTRCSAARACTPAGQAPAHRPPSAPLPPDVLTEKGVEFIHQYEQDRRPFFL